MPRYAWTNSYDKHFRQGALGIAVFALSLVLCGTPQAFAQNQVDFTILSVVDSQSPNLQIQYSTSNMPLDLAYSVELLENSKSVQNKIQLQTNFRHQIAIVLDVNKEYLANSKQTPTPEKPQNYLRNVVKMLYQLYQMSSNSNLNFTEFSLIIPDVDTPNQIVPFEPFSSFMNTTYEELEDRTRFNERIREKDPSDEVTLLKNTMSLFDQSPEVQKTIVFVADGLGSYASGDIQNHIFSTLQGITDTLRIFTIPISETLQEPNIVRDNLNKMASLGNGEMFELSQLSDKWPTIQTIVSGTWTISYTTQQTQPFTLSLKIAGIEHSAQITPSIVAPPTVIVVTSTTIISTTNNTTTTTTVCENQDNSECPDPWGWVKITIISAFFLALIAWIVGAYFLNKGGGTIISNGKDEELQPVINNQLSHVTLLRVKGSEDSPPKIEINHKYGDEVILGRSQDQSLSNDTVGRIYVDGADKIGVSRDHCLIRRIPGGHVEIELLAKNNWIDIHRKGREKPITLSSNENNFKTEVFEGDEIYLGNSSIFKIAEIIRPRMNEDNDRPVDAPTIISIKKLEPIEPGRKDYLPIIPAVNDPIPDPKPAPKQEPSDPNEEHKPV